MTGKQIPPMRSWHKWIGIAIGVVLLVWVVSGIVMMAPHSDALWGTDIRPPALNLDSVDVTAVEAAAIALGTRAGPPAGVRSIALRPLLGTPVYVVQPEAGNPVLVDATRGTVFVITPERARAIAAEAAPRGGALGPAERITVAPIGYNGRLPAYRVAYGDPANTEAVVAEATGEMSRSDGRDRLMKRVGHDLHVFAPLRHLPGGQTMRKAALVLTGVVALLSIGSGYWLALPRWLRRRRSPSA